MGRVPVVSAASQVLAHTPGLARHGSKPRRELPKNSELEHAFLGALRSFPAAAAYPPHQAYLGVLHPRDLPPRPWVGRSDPETSCLGLLPEEEFLGLLAAVDEFGLLTLAPEVAERATAALAVHRLAKRLDLARVEAASGDVEA
ncbi:MAG: glycine/sarcosine/betaine reductase complex component C subunit beta, partial [Egibacteraceae bacterium]